MTYTRDEMEAACCLWEAMLDLEQRDERIRAAFETNGQCAMRDVAMDLACEVNKAWEADEAAHADPFDWDFCPAFIRALDWSQFPPRVVTDSTNG